MNHRIHIQCSNAGVVFESPDLQKWLMLTTFVSDLSYSSRCSRVLFTYNRRCLVTARWTCCDLLPYRRVSKVFASSILQIILFNATWLVVHHQAEKYPHILESSVPCTDLGLFTYLPSAQSPITYIE
ncbi:unnamed protein product [Schistosoma mattheei]|uniref:Uncharacterized protein n=1 Tax=Schistosoma mattheei TaxID=31246 RepID=A0AA85B7J3_9TREM|nr:unnamed protein product [Schistosoma mattheei]